MHVVSMPDARSFNPYQQLLADGLAALGVEVTFPQHYRRVLPLMRAIRGGARPDVLHLHWPSPYLRSSRPLLRTAYCVRTAIDIALVRMSGVPIVWTVHNLVSHDTPTPRAELWLSRRIAAAADRLIVHSPGAERQVVKLLGAHGKTVVIPHGSYGAVYGARMERSQARQRLGIPEPGPMALFFGMIRPYKNVPALLKAWPLVQRERPDAVLLIAGDAQDPDYRAEIKRIAAGAKNVRLDLRHIPDREVGALLSAASLVVLPFTESLTSGTVALANTYCVPIVAPRVEGAGGARLGVFPASTEPAHLAEAILDGFALSQGACDPAAPHAIAVEDGDVWEEIAMMHRDVFSALIEREPYPRRPAIEK